MIMFAHPHREPSARAPPDSRVLLSGQRQTALTAVSPYDRAHRPAGFSAGGRPRRGYVGAPFLTDPCAEAEQRWLGRYLSGDQSLSLMKGDRPLDQTRRDK